MAIGPTLPPQAYTREILTAAFNWLQTQPESVKKLAITPDALVGLYMRAQRYGASSMEADAPVSSQVFMSDLKNLAEGLKQFEEPRRVIIPPPSAVAPPLPTFAIGAISAAQSHQATHQNQMPSQSPQPPQHQNSTQVPHHSGNGLGMQAVAQASASASTNPHSYAGSGSGVHATAGAHAAGPSGAAAAAHAAAQFASQHGLGLQHMHSQAHAHAQATSHQTQTYAPMNHPMPAPPTAAQNEHFLSLVLNERTQQMIQEVKARMNLSSTTEAINMMVSVAYKQIRTLLDG